MAQILILGINHQVQLSRIVNFSLNGSFQAFEHEQKRAFKQLLSILIADRWIRFVGEEAKHGEATIAQEVCDQRHCLYVNIEMSPEERKCRNIPNGYAEHPETSEAEKNRCNQEREEYMCNRTLIEIEQRHPALIICGRLHCDAIAVRFRQSGHIVELDDLQAHDWYIENWMEHMLNNL